MPLGKTIRIYLVDGDPTGVRMVDLSSWTGEAFVCQRSQLASLAQRPEARRTGVYMLVGPDPEHAGKDRVYVGEGDSVLERLTAHDKDARALFLKERTQSGDRAGGGAWAGGPKSMVQRGD